jgi:hypothetical protein
MKPFALFLLIIGSFGAGIAVRDQADDERLEACQQHQSRAVQFSEVLSACLNGYAITDGTEVVACRQVRRKRT